MRKIYLIVLVLFALLAFAEHTPPDKPKFKLPAGVTEKDYLPNTLVIKFKEGARIDAVTQGTEKQMSSKGISLTEIEPVFSPDVEATKFSVQGETNSLGNYYHVKYQGDVGIEAVINTLLQNDNVEYAEPSYIHTTWYTPNDGAYGTQFYLPQVKAPQAWDVIKNSSNVIIGIVDSGSEITHQDLAANIYYNNADPVNGIDDDGDGYVDNYAGWDFCGASAAAMVPDNDPNVKNAAADHGVHVSGIASAVSDNGSGVASLAYNAKLLIVKTGSDDSPRSIFKGYEGIKYAADKGAHIINCSWGGVGGGQFGQDMVDYAISKGCLVVAAAGNSADDVPIYPAAYEGVLSVANLNADDTKGSGSNYGTYVDISAPGQGIYNTVYGNTYGYKSGTSMAAPLVSSAAALLKSKFPSYSGLQIGEILRMTADPIDAQNPNYIGLLGKGRLNAFRALTETVASVRYTDMLIADQEVANRAPNTEIALQFGLKNFLIPVIGLSVNISSNSSYVQVIDQNVNIGNFASLETKNAVVSVKVKILPNAPENHKVIFTLKYTGNGGAYTDWETFETVVALDYLKVGINKVQSTFTSNGRVGYSKASATGGIGFVYQQKNMLYEAALLIAKSESQVMNNARIEGSNYSEDFQRQAAATVVSSSKIADFEAKSVFSDANSANPIGLKVQSRVLAFNSTSNDKYVIVEYEITNTSAADLQNIYTGLFTDWDLDDAAANATEYDATNRTAYVYAKKNATYPYVGIRLLNASAAPAYYPLSYQIANSFLADDTFTVLEKYRSLTSGVQSTGLGSSTTNGYDVMFTLGSGPYNIPKNGAITVAYAFLAGDNKNELLVNSKAAESRYAIAMQQVALPDKYLLGQNYPNAAKTLTYIPVDLPAKSKVNLSIYDIMGRKVAQIIDENLDAGHYDFQVDVSKLAQGTYVYRLTAAGFKQAKKMAVAK